MSEEKEVGGALESPSLEQIVDKPKLTETPSVVVDKPVEQKKAEQKPDEDARFRGLLNETLSEREKRQAAERERDQYRKAWEDHQRKLATEADKDPAPDQFKDPAGYNAWVDRQISKRAEAIAKQQVAPIMERVSDQTLRLSELAAEKHLGADRFGKLNAWIKEQGQQFNDWCLSQPDPYWAAYEQYRQRTTFERLGNDDLETYEAKLRAKILAELKGPIDPPEAGFEDDDPAPQQHAPKSFANGRSADPSRDKTTGRFTGPKPLSEIIGGGQTATRKR